MRIINGDCLEKLKDLPSDTFDSLVTDPPAGISFMGKEWDDDKGGSEQWIAWLAEVMVEALRTMKPGAHGLVWSLPRTSHWTATALERAGFEVRDCVTHLFGTGFPKSLDISKAIDKAAGAEREVIGARIDSDGRSRRFEPHGGSSHGFSGALNVSPVVTSPSTDSARQWSGWGTALKPAAEFWWLVRKPLSEKTVAANVLKWGTGGINIDGARVPSDPIRTVQGGKKINGGAFGSHEGGRDDRRSVFENTMGRFPANLILDEEAAAALDEQSGTLSSGARNGVKSQRSPEHQSFHERARDTGNQFQASAGGASRFFYVAKASKSDRGKGNTHPTVKSTKLMSYLCRLVTPPGGIILDPFMGSGSTGVASKDEGFRFVGIEREQQYAEIASCRMGIEVSA